MRKEFLPLFLVFWLPVMIILGISVYFPLYKFSYPALGEIKLPQEHQSFLNYIKGYKIEAKKEEEIQVAWNPFFQGSGPVAVPSETIQVTSIFNLGEKRACVINNQLYHEGNKVGKIKIAKIGDYYVEVLLPNGKRLRLEVGASFSYTY